MGIGLTGVPGSTVSYNGVKFDELISSNVTFRPVYDEANRMVRYIEYAFSIQAWIYLKAVSTDKTFNQLRTYLTAPGKPFFYDSYGFGTFKINAPGNTVWDVCWGPRPTVADYTNFAGQAALLNWKCIVCIPECIGAATAKKIMAATYGVSWDLDKHGFAVTTIEGEIEIPLTFRNGNRLDDNADAYRELLTFAVPLGFSRTQKYDLSKDRKFLRFHIVDTQLAIPYPPNVTEIDMRHRVSSGNNKGVANLIQWRNVISGNIRTIPGVPKSEAWKVFLKIAGSRISRATQPNLSDAQAAAQGLGVGFSAVVNATGGNNNVVIPNLLEVEEEIFGLSTRATIVYTMTSPKLAAQILVSSGLWQDVGTFWATWRASLSDNAQRVRGNLNLRYNSGDDIFIDLCDKPPSNPYLPSISTSNEYVPGDASAGPDKPPGPLPGNAPSPTPLVNPYSPGGGGGGSNPYTPGGGWGGNGSTIYSPGGGGPNLYAPGGGPGGGGLNTFIPGGGVSNLYGPGGGGNPYAANGNNPASNPYNSASSWLEYEAWLAISEDDQIARHKPLAGIINTSSPTFDPTKLQQVFADKGADTSLTTTNTPDRLQRIASPSFTITLYGRAVRVGYPISPPRLATFRGQKLIQMRSKTAERVSGAVGGKNVYERAWEIVYGIGLPPNGRALLANPVVPSEGSNSGVAGQSNVFVPM